MARLSHLLVANRGEIAVRVLRAARALGYRTTAVYSEADAGSPHLRLADAAVCLGPARLSESYLNVEGLLDAARKTGADAVHPGYGMLSENAAFARACEAAGLTFVGPRPETIELMGDKRRARLHVQAAGVPCVPGYDAEDSSDAALLAAAARLGFPLMVKAVAGGGGRGLRRVFEPAELGEALARARSEAEHAFGDGRLLLERVIAAARHVEVQILADAHATIVSLGERDCSAQRRFQKVIEEAPSPAVTPALRERLGELARRVAKSAGYLGAGTIEMLLDPQGELYFLEMNTRIQVEHPVTELVTGEDLVAWQLRIANGERLSFGQEQVRLGGHAIEARVYAEDPARAFLPQTGRVLALELPEGQGVRVDHALAQGLVISAHYDALLAKIIAHGRDRDEALSRLLAALARTRILGLPTNLAFLQAVLAHERFVSGAVTTEFLDAQLHFAPPEPEAWLLAAACALFCGRIPRTELFAFTNCAGLSWPLVLGHGDRRTSLRVAPARGGELLVQVGEARLAVSVEEASDRASVLVVDGVRRRVHHAFDQDTLFLAAGGASHAFFDLTHAPKVSESERGTGKALAPMDGVVVEVLVRAGDRVTRGQSLAVIEAMKLELRVAADLDGVVRAVHVERGAQVRARALLVEVEAG